MRLPSSSGDGCSGSKDAEAAGQRILADAQAEATRQKDRALADIESAKVAALSELGAKSTDIAFSLARGIVGRELKLAITKS